MQTDTILHGDIRQIARTLPAGSVHCIVTSPPYYCLRDYGVEGQIGLEASPQEYVDTLVGIFRELRRVLRDDGVVFLNLGDSYAGNNTSNGAGETRNLKTEKFHGGKAHLEQRRVTGNCDLPSKNLLGIPWRCALALQADGWYLRSDIIWSKPNPMPESVTDRPTKAHEYIFLLSKSPRYYYDQEAVREPNSDSSGGWQSRSKNGILLSHSQGFGGNGQTSQFDSNTQEKGVGRGGVAAQNPAGRNRRTVWTCATQPYAEAHFATFPPDLIRPCILAGCPAKVCADCGAPWVRVVEKTGEKIQHHGINGVADKARGRHGKNSVFNTGFTESKETTGFEPTCTCNAPTVPGIVFDPFLGSGTVAQVAIEEGRNWLGCELSQDYIDLAWKRIDAAKLAKVAGRDYAKVMTKEENGYQQLGLIGA